MVRDSPPRLIIVTDAEVAPIGRMEGLLERALSTARAGTVLVQLRDPQLPVRERLALGQRLADACARHQQWFAVNDSADLAVLLRAPALHLGEASVTTADARRVLPSGTWISRACHDVSLVGATSADGTANGSADECADGVLLSPIAAARKGRPALGVAGVRAARRVLDAMPETRRPCLYALGGIDAGNAADAIAAGADGVAVIGAVLNGHDPRPLLAALGIVR